MAGRSGRVPAAACASRSAVIVMTKPGVQKPHCEPWHATSACCTGCGCGRSSTVMTARPSSVGRKLRQALTLRIATPPGAVSSRSATSTVQAPQSPSLQPSLVPVQRGRASSRSQSSSVRVGGTPSSAMAWPRWTKRIGRGEISGMGRNIPQQTRHDMRQT